MTKNGIKQEYLHNYTFITIKIESNGNELPFLIAQKEYHRPTVLPPSPHCKKYQFKR